MIEKPLKPAEFAEKKIVEAILDQTYKPGDDLPAERVLSVLLGVTRPTLRETLQRLSKDGWVSIRHGKATRVNDYLTTGGLGVLQSLARYGSHLSRDMVSHLLEVRIALFPDIAEKAARKRPEDILQFLKASVELKDRPGAYADFDWGLQVCMVKACGNPVYHMILNDFTPLYGVLAETYFQNKEARSASLEYYRGLSRALLQHPGKVKQMVEQIMIRSHTLWQVLK